MSTLPLRLLTPCLLVIAFTGCSWIPYAIDNVENTSVRLFSEHRFKRQAQQLANEAWAIESNTPHCIFKHSKSAYEDGFKAGFIDYLNYNGNAEPPAAPPRYLRRNILRTPEQQQDILDWYAGFRHGAATAAQAQWRDRIVVPMSLPANQPEEKYGVEIIPRNGIALESNAVPGAATFEPAPAQAPPFQAPPPRRIEEATDGVAVFD